MRTRKCTCENIQLGEPYTPSQCRLCWLYHHNARYRALCDNQPLPPPKNGPGSELKKLLLDWGIDISSDCGCASKAQLMDTWGVKGCQENRDKIVSWLIEAAGDRILLAYLTAGWFVDESIRRAEAKLETPRKL